MLLHLCDLASDGSTHDHESDSNREGLSAHSHDITVLLRVIQYRETSLQYRRGESHDVRSYRSCKWRDPMILHDHRELQKSRLVSGTQAM